jgi:Cu(I)/Ag(I) efflux system periplasmic protein CusF
MNRISKSMTSPPLAHRVTASANPWRRAALAWATALPLLAAAAFLATAAPRANAQAATAATDWTDAEVRKVDREANKLTLKHAEIKSLDMPPMTMVFQARDKAMLEGLEPGSKIRFRAGREKGQYMVMELQKAP